MIAAKKFIVVSISLSLLGRLAVAQSTAPSMGAYTIESRSHEDLSDVIRLFPGMYPQDLGTLHAPLYFLPWGLWPGQMRYVLDGLPLERRYDGLWDPGMLPVSEIDSIAFQSVPVNGLFPGAGGRLSLITRDLPVDSPYSEIRLREGYYGFGTVDFAHGQGVYKMLDLQVTGRLGWYDGMRDRTASRLTRVRGKLRWRATRNWRIEGLCHRSKLHADSELNGQGETLMRTEGQLALLPTDSMRSAFRPTARLFLREDKERWGDPWTIRDLTGGALFDASLLLPRQRLQATGLARLSSLSLPEPREFDSRDFELSLADSVDVAGLMGIELGCGVHSQDDWDGAAARFGAHGVLPVGKVCTAFGGFQRFEQYPAPLWVQGGYSLTNRPLLIAPSLANLSDSLIGCPLRKEKISQAQAGVSVDWSRLKFWGSAVNIVIDDMLLPWTSTAMPDPSTDSRWGGAFQMQLALRRDLCLESRWSVLWTSETDYQKADETRGFTRLYFDRAFFKAPLHVRASLSHTYLGERTAFSYLGYKQFDPVHLAGFRVSMRIRGLMLFWGTENIGAKHYEYVPGFLMIRKEEYWGLKWIFHY